MTLKNVLEAVLRAPGIHQAFLVEKDVIEEVFRQEDVVEDTTFGMPLDNRALKACRERSGHIIVFCDYSFELPTDHLIIMEDESGNLIGFDIPVGKKGEYEGRTDLVWLSEDFALNMDADCDVATVVMLPQKVGCVNEVDGARDPVLLYPSTTTDMYIRDRLGVNPESPDIATAILSFHIV